MRNLTLLSLFALLNALLLSGCIYKLDTQQGNIIEAEQFSKLEAGMSKAQVRDLLGSPTLIDPFREDRWDYVYYFRNGATGKEEGKRISMFFENEVLVRTQRAVLNLEFEEFISSTDTDTVKLPPEQPIDE